MRRRAAVCKVNDCCMYRGNLCQGECIGEEGLVLTFGNEVYILEGGALNRYLTDAKTRKFFQDHDRGKAMHSTKLRLAEVKPNLPPPMPRAG